MYISMNDTACMGTFQPALARSVSNFPISNLVLGLVERLLDRWLEVFATQDGVFVVDNLQRGVARVRPLEGWVVAGLRKSALNNLAIGTVSLPDFWPSLLFSLSFLTGTYPWSTLDFSQLSRLANHAQWSHNLGSDEWATSYITLSSEEFISRNRSTIIECFTWLYAMIMAQRRNLLKFCKELFHLITCNP